jgi:ketosteroid isomerase-like protein
MSQENVEIVKAANDAMAQQGLDALAEYWADDIEWRAVEGALDDRGPLRGKDACRAYVQDWLDTFDQLTVEPEELIDAGTDQVVGILRLAGRAKLSGIETNLTYAVVYGIRDGKIAWGREYASREDALEAAGLRA